MDSLAYRSIFDHLHQGIICFDIDGKIVYANQKAQQHFQLSEKQLLEATLPEFVNYFTPDGCSPMSVEDFPFYTVLSEKKELTDLMTGFKVPGQENASWFNLNATPVLSGENEVLFVVLSFSKSKYLETEETFSQLIKNSYDTLVLIDSNGIQRYVSDSCEKSHGYKPSELTDINVIEEMIHPEDQPRVLQSFQRVLEQDDFHAGVQYRHKHKNGGWVYLEAFASNQIKNPHINAVVLNIHDITERRLYEQKLKENEAHLTELNATKDKFFSIIAHDLINPFHSIVGYGDLALHHLRNEEYEGLEKFLNVIQSSSQATLDLLMNLLDWAQSQTGRIKFYPEILEITPLIMGILNLFFGPAEQKSITIYVELPPDLKIYGDKAMMSTVFRNLISNAIKFTRTGGEIVVAAKPEANKIIFSVSDNGVGMTSEAISKLFKIEEGLSTLGTKNEKGSGLGLILCKEFAEKHGGRIDIDSAVNEGTVIHFSIPNAD
jgi:PAS domain S-box